MAAGAVNELFDSLPAEVAKKAAKETSKVYIRMALRKAVETRRESLAQELAKACGFNSAENLDSHVGRTTVWNCAKSALTRDRVVDPDAGEKGIKARLRQFR